MVPADFDEAITFRRMRTWHALVEGDTTGDAKRRDPSDPACGRDTTGDAKRRDPSDPACGRDASGEPELPADDVPPRDEADGRPLKSWVAYIDAGDFDDLVALDPHVLAQIWRHTDGKLSYLIQRGLEALVDKLEQDAAWRPGSSAAPPRVTRAPQAVDPVSADEARAVIEALALRDFERAVRTAERIAGEAAVPLRGAPPAPGPEDPEARRAVSDWLARQAGDDR